MKKSLILLTAALTFGSMASAQTTAPASAPQVPALTDVPAGHWSKDAIEKLVSRGIILGYPDGTYRGTQNLTRYEAAVIIARLLDQMRQGTVTNSLDAETVTSLQNAIQELAADLAALGVRVTDLEENAVSKDDFARLEQRVEDLAGENGDPEALANIQAQIDELTARADEFDALRADVDDNASSIAALNDLTVLLNQDILDLQDRVSAVEAAQADFVTRTDFDNLSTRVTGIDTRVTALERLPRFTVVGSITPNYGRIGLTAGGTNFDVDRLTANTPLSSSNGGFADGDVTTTDTTTNYTSTGLGFGIRASNLTTANGSFIVNSAEINFGTTNAANILGGAVGVVVNDASANGTFGGQKFDVRYSAYQSNFKFQNYLFNNSNASGNRRGFVANIATTLPGNPSLTIVAGNTNAPQMTGQPNTAAANYYGVRAAYNPTGVGSFGVSYAQVDGFRSALGTDFNVKFGPLALVGEGVVSVPSTAANSIALGNFRDPRTQADGAGYVEGRVDLAGIKFGANVRAINPEFAVVGDGTAAGFNAGMQTANTMPYTALDNAGNRVGQVGYGAALGTDVGPVALGAYVDSRTDFFGANRVTGFGVKAGAKLGALELVGFYNNLTVNGVAADGSTNFSSSNQNINTNGAGMGISNVPLSMTSSFGAQVSHSGTAANALVRNLNFTVGDAYFYVGNTNRFYAFGDYSGNIGGFTINPLFRYNLVTDRDTTANNFNTIKYGVKIASPTLTGVPFEPSIYFNVANRITNNGTATGVQANGTSTELLGQVGISLNNVLATGVSAKVGYSYYQGFGVAANQVTAGTSNDAFNASVDHIYGARVATNDSAKMDGVYGQVAYQGLSANYGVFRYTNLLTNQQSVAQGFKVGYSFRF
ncbi:S-layer-like y domain-containing protein [Deinococcus deserti]|uniref:Putative S-layer protein n=1 Tax=Deinococcus deserti (strain DSM 17065 / CIP 109153 / LMG 22923 / VCD115) TaxID=546414 RepID=C1CYP9_DEIDV|nr:S-layer homology domain-containing protein [Deinococcus deserti]ACO47079.1 putative S-layer protein, precursor [Deinococcus deserti VCD115]